MTVNTREVTRGLVRTLTGEADIDVSAAVYTSPVVLLTVALAAGEHMSDVEIHLDLAKATTGFAANNSTETIQFHVERKVDGSNWRMEAAYPATALSGTLAASCEVRLQVGDVDAASEFRVSVVLSAETGGDVEIPYLLKYRGHEPTVTAVAIP